MGPATKTFDLLKILPHVVISAVSISVILVLLNTHFWTKTWRHSVCRLFVKKEEICREFFVGPQKLRWPKYFYGRIEMKRESLQLIVYYIAEIMIISCFLVDFLMISSIFMDNIEEISFTILLGFLFDRKINISYGLSFFQGSAIFDFFLCLNDLKYSLCSFAKDI